MSKKTNHIDEIVRQKLLNAEVGAPVSAWDRLQKDLDITRSRKRIVLFTRLAGMAAILIIFIGLGFFILTPSNKDNQIADTKIITDSTTITNDQIKSLAFNHPKSFSTRVNSSKIILSAISITQTEIVLEKEIKMAYLKLLDFIYPIDIMSPEPTLIAQNKLYKKDAFNFDWSKFEYTESTEMIAESEKEWKVGLGLSPSYTSRSANNDLADYPGSSEDYYEPAFYRSSEKLIPSLTFGANLAYSLSDRWSLLSGVFYLNQKNEIQNFQVFENSARTKSRFSTNSSMGNIQISNSDVIYKEAEFINQLDIGLYSNVSNYNSNLIQQFEYIEIPLLISYKLINSRWTISLLTGFNTGFLIGNSVYLKDYRSEKVGSTEDINTLSFKSVFGISFEYPLSKRLFLNVSPTYKYQMNSINKTRVNNYHLQFFDIKTGISYHF